MDRINIQRVPVRFKLNGELVYAQVKPNQTLLRFLRDELHHWEVKEGCGDGNCGACTVLVDNVPRPSCLLLAAQVDGADVTTVCGLGDAENLHALQEAFIRHGAIQCGFCTPGMLTVVKALLDNNPYPTREEIREALSGNLCRCTGYQKIIDAVEEVSKTNSSKKHRVEEVVNSSRLIGESIPRLDALDKALGKTRYAQDYSMPGMLHAGVLRSPYPSAQILSIDTTLARQIKGLHAIITGGDIPGKRVFDGPLKIIMPVLAIDKVSYVGQGVAIVAAESLDIVEDALRLIKVEYEQLPAVFDPLEALQPNAPKIGEKGNIANQTRISRGDVVQGFANADAIVEERYQTKRIDHLALETESGTAWIDENDIVTIRMATQMIGAQKTIASVLGVPNEKVRVIAPMVGGGFGRKLDVTIGLYLALLAKETSKPVYLSVTREESIVAFSKRHPFTMHYKTAATKDGKLLSMQVKILVDTGPFANQSHLACLPGLMCATGPYYIPNVEIDLKVVHTNNVYSGAMRGIGMPQVNFAYESQIDALARVLNMDPVSLRYKNYLKTGQSLPNEQVIHKAVLLNEATQEVVQALGEPNKPSLPFKKIGQGISATLIGWGFPNSKASCEIILHDDGTAHILIGVSDIGGGQSSTIAQIVADTLGVSMANISMEIADTSQTPSVGPTAASKTLYYCGNAAFMAANTIRKRLIKVATDLFKTNPLRIKINNGMMSIDKPEKKCIPLLKVIKEAKRRGVSLHTMSTFHTPSGKRFDPDTGDGVDWIGLTFGVHGVEIEIDEETGEITVLKYIAAHDVGRAINPQIVVGQIQGGCIQGLGFTLSEEVIIEDGFI